MKTSIHKLSKDVISYIAAGQVVESPASVVKELVENALDAGARRIIVEISGSGLESITVTDNGKGMNREDLEMCFQPYTTSKIHSVDDLLHVQTAGFRGEALASMAAVGTLVIQSKQTDSAVGWQVTVKMGTCISCEPCGAPDGTRVRLQNLFSDIPARKKFIKSAHVEIRKIIKIMTSFALAHTSIAWRLVHDGRDVLHVAPSMDEIDRMAYLLDKRFAQHAMNFDVTDEALHVSGYIGHPSQSTRSDNQQYIFVNSRPVSNADIKKALKQAYGSLLAARLYPMCVLHIDLPREYIDVNVDPRKDTVRFVSSQRIAQRVGDICAQVLQSHDLRPSVGMYAHDQNMDLELADQLRKTVRIWSVKNINNHEIAQVLNTYLVMEDDESLVLIDQHAAHERILYEQYLAEYRAQSSTVQSFELEKPVVLQLSVTHVTLLEQERVKFEALGFRLGLAGTHDYIIEAVPNYLKGRDPHKSVVHALESLASDESVEDSLTDKTITYLACRSAIMAGDVLTGKERKRLIKKLLMCENPYTCPHGRPTMIKMTRKDLETLFKRR